MTEMMRGGCSQFSQSNAMGYIFDEIKKRCGGVCHLPPVGGGRFFCHLFDSPLLVKRQFEAMRTINQGAEVYVMQKARNRSDKNGTQVGVEGAVGPFSGMKE